MVAHEWVRALCMSDKEGERERRRRSRRGAKYINCEINMWCGKVCVPCKMRKAENCCYNFLSLSLSVDSALFGGGLLPEHTDVYSKIIVITIKCNTVSDKTNAMKRKWRSTFGNVKCNHTQTTNANRQQPRNKKNRGKRRRRRQQPTKVIRIRIQSKTWNVRLKK